MNKMQIKDAIWKGYFLLPHCIINRKRNRKRLRMQFDYAKDSDISIVATNCIGGILYSLLGLQFTSPFINVSIDRRDFVQICAHFKEYMELELCVSKDDRGRWCGSLESDQLKKVIIRFPHDDKAETIQNNWEKRKSRINYDKLVFICDDQKLCEEDYVTFDKVECYKKILFTAKNREGQYPWCHQLIRYAGQQYTGMYNAKSFRGGWVFEYDWNFSKFLKGECE